MIRTVKIPRGVSRMGAAPGSVGMGTGGDASSFSYSPSGLSNDPQLAPYLQDLTRPQLQQALDGLAPSAVDMGIYDNTILTTCEQNYDPTICGPGGANSTNPIAMSLGLSSNNLVGAVPTWAWLAGAGVLGFLLVRR